jgi:predicted nucleic acid-binding protein
MSALLMLDTNAVPAFVKNRANTLSATVNDRPFCTSVITEAELRFGLVRSAAIRVPTRLFGAPR